MTDQATVRTYRHLPHYIIYKTDWEQFGRALPKVVATGAVAAVVVTIFAIGLLEVMP
jgi:hypothetical protein